MKKYLALAMAAVMTLGVMTGCAPAEAPDASTSTPSTSTPDVSTPEVEELKVGVFYYDFSDVYISSVRTNMDKQLNDMGVKFTNYDGAAGQAAQSEQITTAITNGANLLIVNIYETSSPDAAQNATDAAKAAGIPIIFFNREVADEVVASYENCAFVGTNAPEAGHMQGSMIGDFLIENYDAVDLNGDGTISYVMFKGQEGNAEAEARTQFGVEDADLKLVAADKTALSFYNAGNADKYLVDQQGKWSAQAANEYMGTILAEYSEANNNMVEIVIANNDGMAEGAISALQSAGYNTGDEGSYSIPVFGVDATDSAKQLIDEGKMTGTIMQDAAGMASTIATLVGSVEAGDAVMADTADYNVDEGVAKIRVPYGVYTK